jgi:hypothetical protein
MARHQPAAHGFVVTAHPDYRARRQAIQLAWLKAAWALARLLAAAAGYLGGQAKDPHLYVGIDLWGLGIPPIVPAKAFRRSGLVFLVGFTNLIVDGPFRHTTKWSHRHAGRVFTLIASVAAR